MKEFHGHALESLELETSNRKSEGRIHMDRITQLESISEAAKKRAEEYTNNQIKKLHESILSLKQNDKEL